MRIRCWRCGHAEIIFTVRGDRFGHHHGAICAHCRKPVTLKDCLFRSVMIAPHPEEHDIFQQIADNAQPLPEVAKPSGER